MKLSKLGLILVSFNLVTWLAFLALYCACEANGWDKSSWFWSCKFYIAYALIPILFLLEILGGVLPFAVEIPHQHQTLLVPILLGIVQLVLLYVIGYLYEILLIDKLNKLLQTSRSKRQGNSFRHN